MVEVAKPMLTKYEAIILGSGQVWTLGLKRFLGPPFWVPMVGEGISMIQVATMGKLKYTALHDAIFAHPLFEESVNNLFNKFEGE
jgi:hypothetical protein